MRTISSHVNPGRLAIALVGTAALLALLSSAVVAGAPGASASASLSASPSRYGDRHGFRKRNL